ncbi:hypothetical protein CRE_20740 [Caenorhabditis remanei]|uniref:Uncharacterized protein n=1 Tax=Caenorhabditis remanei TaxID=31234 RepID=E3MFB7_CAERE|nr:hypothetical protein CRE_20740 [Caenorhabditis remanei]
MSSSNSSPTIPASDEVTAKGNKKKVPVDGKKRIVVTDDTEHIVVHTLDIPNNDPPENGSFESKPNVSNQKLAKQGEQHWKLELLGIEPPKVVCKKLDLMNISSNTRRNDIFEMRKIHLPYTCHYSYVALFLLYSFKAP